jgi:hypothetical protein
MPRRSQRSKGSASDERAKPEAARLCADVARGPVAALAAEEARNLREERGGR